MPRVLTADMYVNRSVRVYKIQSMPCLNYIRILEKRYTDPWGDVYLAEYFKGPWKGAQFFVRE